MKKNPKLKEPFLNGEQLYRRYFSMGASASIVRLTRWAVSVGMAKTVAKGRYNKEGLPCMGVWKAMWRWATLKENKEIAREIFFAHVSEYGWDDDDDYPWAEKTTVELSDWNRFMIKKIQTAWQFPENRYNRFLRENGWI